MAASASKMATTINRILDLFSTFSDGLTDKIMEENLKDVDLNVRAQAINALLQKRQLQVFKQGDFIVYKQQTKEESVRFKGLSSEDMLIYQAIKNAGNMGIWTKDMKRETNLQQPQVNKALKNLEARGLIKGVKCVSNQAKKVYMLAELTPSKEITGGAWYTGQNFDTEFTNIVKQQCLQFVLQQGVATIESVADFVRKSGISKVELKVEELKQVFALRNLLSNYSLMEEDKREDVEAKHREFTEDDMNEKGAQSETSMSSVLDFSVEQSSRQPFTALSQEYSDLALARALQEQERAYMLLQRNAEFSDYESSGSGNNDHEYYIDDSGENEDEVVANAGEFEGEGLADGDCEEVDASLFESDEAYARALQEAEDRLLTTRMMALAGINDREEDDNEDDDSTSRDAWQDIDPDNMLYEELVALSEVVGTQSRGLPPDLISSLPLSKYVPESPSSSNSEKCVICHLEYEGGDIIQTLPCKHQYHSDCIKIWLQINKICPVCCVEVSDRTNH